MNLILCVDFGSTYTKLTAIDKDSETIIATAKSFTTIEDNIMNGFNKAKAELETKLPKKDINWVAKLGCSSAAGGLKMCVIGNVPELTTDAAKKAALGAGARILKAYHFEQTEDDIKEMLDLNADMILLAGGTDGGNETYITANAKLLAKCKFPKPIVIAGNKSCQKQIGEILKKAGCKYYITENIMPQLNALNVEPARETIRKVFMEHIIDAKGLHEAINLVQNEIIPTPLSVLNAAHALATGSDTEEGIGELVIVDIGGATTDVHSIAKGLPSKGDVSYKGMEEPFDKRTVEGDLGMRYSAKALLEAVTTKRLQKYLNELGLKLENEQVWEQIERRAKSTGMIPKTKSEILFDQAMAMACTDVSMLRHAGYIEVGYSLFGPTYNQYGKDLTQLKYMIGTGGVIVHSDSPAQILKKGFYNQDDGQSLRPMNAKFLLDKEYALSAIGLVCDYDKNLAVRLMKKYLTEIGEK